MVKQVEEKDCNANFEANVSIQDTLFLDSRRIFRFPAGTRGLSLLQNVPAPFQCGGKANGK
jgi:hypothetical protein